MGEITVSAKTVDDAITEALIQLGVTSDMLEYDVIEKGSSGFLGIGSKQAVIRAWKKKTVEKEDELEELKEEIQEVISEVKGEEKAVKPEMKSEVKEKKPRREKKERKEFYENQFRMLTKMACEEAFDVVFFDELIYTIGAGLFSENLLLDFLKNKPKELEVILTGQGPSSNLIEAADYVSEIRKIKHPFDKGMPSRKGIEK